MTCNIKTAVEAPCGRTIPLLPLLGRFGSLDLFCPTELGNGQVVSVVALADANKHTFFARFLRSLRNLREAFSTLGERPACTAMKCTL